MRTVLSEHVDPETGEKWELVKFKSAITYVYWVDYYRYKDSDYPHAAIPFTPSAEKWQAEIMKERRQENENQATPLDGN